VSKHELERDPTLVCPPFEKGQFEGLAFLARVSTSHEWSTCEDTVFVVMYDSLKSITANVRTAMQRL